MGVALGDLGLAYQAFKVAVNVDPQHGEALNNIAVLEMRRQKADLARSCLTNSMDVGSHLFEPFYNSGMYLARINHVACLYMTALLAYRQGDFQDAFSKVTKALSIFPGHSDSNELKETLEKLFAHM